MRANLTPARPATAHFLPHGSYRPPASHSVPFSTTSHPRPGLARGLIPLPLPIPSLIPIKIKIRITTRAGVSPRVTLQCYKEHYRTTKPILFVRFSTRFNFSKHFLSKNLRSKNKLCTKFNPLSGFFINILSHCTYLA